MRDVATRAGVSPKTVSNVINGVVFVRPDTRERVEQAMAELDYVPNLSARGLRNGRSGVLALALPNLDTQYSAETIGAFVEAAHGRGWAIQVEETGAEPQRERELLSRARAHLVDGLILNPITLEDSVIAQVQNLPPLVLIGIVVVMQVGAKLFVGRNYALALLFITPLALCMVQLANPLPANQIVADRAIETVLGIAIAMIITLVTRERRQRGDAD